MHGTFDTYAHDYSEKEAMLDPRKILVSITCHDGRLMCETAGSIISCAGLYAAVTMPAECSNVSLVRNIIADRFINSSFEWLVCIDSDIAFSREDFLTLLQPIDLNAAYQEDNDFDFNDAPAVIGSSIPTPTRIDTGTDSGTRAMADVLVCAEYPFKNDDLEPVKLGMGFVRIHRSVFRMLQELKHPDTGEPRLWQCSHKGRIITDFFPTGPVISTFVPTAEWKGEDHGFFTLCMLAGLIPRIETRTQLTHIGRKGYPYAGPGGSGQ